MKKVFILFVVVVLVLAVACYKHFCVSDDGIAEEAKANFPEVITVENIAQNPEGIEFNKKDNTFLLSSLNAGPIIKVNTDGTFLPFTGGEDFPLSSAGLQIDYERNRLLATGFNGMELLDEDPETKGVSYLRVYNLQTGVIEKDINLSSLAPEANAYFANDIAVDNAGNAYVSDWYAGLIYKVDTEGNPSVFWTNTTGIPSGPNGLDFHPDGYLLVSVLNVNDKGLYADYGLVKIPVNNPAEARVVDISNTGFSGFDGMLLGSEGSVVGVTNDRKTPGGNMLIQLKSKNDWQSAEVINSKSINPSTTVAVTPIGENFVINQDFSASLAETWTIEKIEF